MDTSDPAIEFDAQGVCNHCRGFDEEAARSWFPDEAGRRMLAQIVHRIKEEGRRRPYDCVLGLSGGVDSSYLAYVVVRELGLRPLAVHVDAGWNSELAVRNIETLVKGLGLDLHTHVVDWEEMRDLQVAFLKSSVANQDVPQDHAFSAAVYDYAIANGIRYVLSGGNVATESVMPASWAHDAMDLRHLRAIHRRFGSGRLKTFPTVSFFKYYFYYPYVRGMTVIRPLNYMRYEYKNAIRVLQSEFSWRYYGGKHFESRFTKWQQAYYRPAKFGYDERRAYYSSLVISGQLSRGAALSQLATPVYDRAEQLSEDTDFVRKKLRLSEAEFQRILALPPRTYLDYPSNHKLLSWKNKLRNFLGRHGVKYKTK